MANPSGTNLSVDSGATIGGIQVLVGSTSATVISGTGLTAAKGSLFVNTGGDGVANRLYVNTDGGTIWTAVSTVA